MHSSPDLQEITAFLIEQLVQRLGSGAAEIDRDGDLIELGLASIDAVLVSGEIEDRFGIEVDPVLLFECRTVNRVARTIEAAVAAR